MVNVLVFIVIVFLEQLGMLIDAIYGAVVIIP